MSIVRQYNIEDRRMKLTFPTGFRILTAQNQRNQLIVWVEVDTDNHTEFDVEFLCILTGEEIPDDERSGMNYIATVQIEIFVYHVFWREV